MQLKSTLRLAAAVQYRPGDVNLHLAFSTSIDGIRVFHIIPDYGYIKLISKFSDFAASDFEGKHLTRRFVILKTAPTINSVTSPRIEIQLNGRIRCLRKRLETIVM